LVYATVGDLSREVSKLQDAAPDAARRIEASRRFGRTARDFGLTKRVTDFVNDLPKHISGSAASVTARGIAYVAGIVLTIFLLLYGGRLVDGLLRQIRDDTRRANAARVLEDGYRRWWRYVVLTLGRAAVAGLFGYVVCRVAGLPGAVVLSLVVGIFALIPYLGVLVGSVPIVLLAVGVNPSVPPVLELLAVFITYQLLEAFLVQPRLESASIRVGPAVTFLVAIVAFDLYGIGGALYGVAAATFVVAVLDELAPTDADTVDLSELDRPVSP
jgi:predicted PurR-regulated permease PerM